jgi:hypothetical protein
MAEPTFGSLLGLLVPNPLPAANITSAALFLPLDEPTLARYLSR